MLGELGKDSPLAPQVSEILRAGEKAALLTRQLLAFSRRQVLAPKIIDLNGVIADMHKLLSDFIGGSVRVHYRPGTGLARVNADPAQVEQALLNLALNAKDAMPQGGEMFIETANAAIGPGDLPPDPIEGEPRQGPYTLLSVRDTGVGMDEDIKAHLFEPFFTTKGRAQGLGLSAVYGIIKQSGGYISVTSQKGQGTVIRLYWPDAETAPSEDPPDAPKPGHGPIILVAEDDELQRMVIREMLEGHGFSVMLAGSGKEALEMARRVSDPIDLLLADVMMPGMDGLELAYTLNVSRPEIKMLFMSGYTDYLQVRQGVLEAHLAFIGKPFSARDLLVKIEEVLAVRHFAG